MPWAKKMNNEIFIKLITICGRQHVGSFRINCGIIKTWWRGLWQLRLWMQQGSRLQAPAASCPASVRPRLKYALGIICAAARNLPHARISDSRRRWVRQVYRQKNWIFIYPYIYPIHRYMSSCSKCPKGNEVNDSAKKWALNGGGEWRQRALPVQRASCPALCG